MRSELIPPGFACHIGQVHGPAGETWLAGLPALLSECIDQWGLEIQPPFALSYNYVAPAVRADGTPVVLKACPPNPEVQTEIAALQWFDGRGMVRLLEADLDRGLLLLEQLRPGRSLFELGDDRQATSIAAAIMRRFWRPPPAEHAFPTVARWAQGLQRLRARFEGGTGPLPPSLVERAEKLFAELLSTQGEPVLLHGDLHHWNILSAGREPWLAIDPKGVVGEPAYEVGPWLYNPILHLLSWPSLDRVIARRLDQLAEELELDRERLAACGLARAVLSAAWSVEEAGDWTDAITVAQLLADMM